MITAAFCRTMAQYNEWMNTRLYALCARLPTHHRGQVTTLLTQRGHDIGSTDIPFMPALQA